MLTLLLMSPEEDPARLLAAYHTCLVTNAIAFDPDDQVNQLSLDAIVLRRLAADLPRLPHAAVTAMLNEIHRAGTGYPAEQARSTELATEILPSTVWPEAFRPAGPAATP